jgi:hypothetical protein
MAIIHIRRCQQLLVLACLAVLIGTGHGQTAQITPNEPNTSDWEKDFVDGASSNHKAVRTELSVLTSKGGHLVGEFHITNLSATTIELTGKETSDGKFWPNIVPEVTGGQTQADWKWKPLDPTVVPGKTATLTVAPQTFSKPLFVDIDIFKGAVNTATYGRVVFADGKWSMFELNDLLPSRTATR